MYGIRIKRKMNCLKENNYDENTVINFCCRSDNGSPKNPMWMPTETSFVLYRYNKECQKVTGMIVVEDYIHSVE